MSKYKLDAKLVIISFPPEIGRKISDVMLVVVCQVIIKTSGELWGISFNGM